MFSIHPSRATAPFRVLCNPKVQQIILDRYYNVPSFNRSMTDYVAGFGDAVNDLWIGLEKLHLLTSSMSYALCVQVIVNNFFIWMDGRDLLGSTLVWMERNFFKDKRQKLARKRRRSLSSKADGHHEKLSDNIIYWLTDCVCLSLSVRLT